MHGIIPEAKLESTDSGLVPAGDGWLVLNAADALARRPFRRLHAL